MRTWTMSACGVLAWSSLSVVLLTNGMTGSVPPTQANARAASSTEITLTSSTGITLTSSTGTPLTSGSKVISRAGTPATAARPDPRYVVQNGDTLSAIAARFAVRGGWPALFAANRGVIGPDPDAIHPGTVLVLPGSRRPGRYVVRAGDTLAGIATGLAVPGGWPVLYAANRPVIGPDPNSLRPGTVLRIPQSAAPAPAGAGHARRPRPAQRPRPTSPPVTRPRPGPTANAAPHPGMPGWLKLVLLSVALFVLVGFLAEPVLVLRRRARERARAPRNGASWAWHAPRSAGAGGPAGGRPGGGQQADPARPGVVLADHDRLVVTHDRRDDTVYVLRPPGADPRMVLRVARLVLAEEPYGELARLLGLPGLGPVD